MHLGGYLVLIVEVLFTIWCTELEQVSVSAEAVGIFNSKAFHGRNGTKEGRGGVGADTSNASAARSVRAVRDVSTIKFFLYVGKYTGIGNGRQIFRGNKQDLLHRGFIRDAPTKIICHGYSSSYSEGPGELLVPAYLAAWEGRPLNVISVDWSQMSFFWGSKDDGTIWFNGLYTFPAGNTEDAGHTVGAMIEFLVKELGTDLDKFHLIGHSLGAHVMGYAGRHVKAKFGRRVGRITALDPASPCFENFRFICFKGDYQPISSADAKFVDAIHTNAQLLGMKEPVGDVDFYPNGGFNQPGCPEAKWVDIFFSLIGLAGDVFVAICSHARAIELMRESILNKGQEVRAHLCRDVTAWSTGVCGLYSDDFALLGEPCSSSSRGIFFVQTKSEYPYISKALRFIHRVTYEYGIKPALTTALTTAKKLVTKTFGKLFG